MLLTGIQAAMTNMLLTGILPAMHGTQSSVQGRTTTVRFKKCIHPQMCMRMVRTCVHMHARTRTRTCARACTYTYTHRRLHTCLYICQPACLRKYPGTHVYIWVSSLASAPRSLRWTFGTASQKTCRLTCTSRCYRHVYRHAFIHRLTWTQTGVYRHLYVYRHV